MSEFDPKHSAESDSALPTPGATGIFGVVSPAPASEPMGAAAGPAARSHPATPPAQPFARPAPSPVVVHEVKFQAQDADGSEAESSLQRLLQSLAPAEEIPVPVPGAGEFTQLLSTQQVPPAPVPAPALTAATPPLQPAVSSQAGTFTAESLEMPVAATSVASSAPKMVPAQEHHVAEVDGSSFTRLFEALAAPAAAPGVAVPLGLPHTVDLTADLTAGKAAVDRPAVHVPPPPAAGAPEPHLPGSGFAGGADAASFTQLFNALGGEPRPAAGQGTDYPPLTGRRPSFPSPSSDQPPGFSGGGWSLAATSPALPPAPLRSDEGSDLHSLTQLLMALEHPPAGPSAAGVPPGLAGRDAGPSSATGGPTVAFTPPESVQRRAIQPPAAASGPGDFTRVLQASALRESGLGSQAAAAQHPPVAPAPSASPVHGAGAPLPPWAAPPMPYAPQLSGLAHANGSLPGLGPTPGINMHAQGPHLHMPPAFLSPAPPPQAGQGTQGPWGKAGPRGALLPLILMAIIVILVGVLVAVLLRH